MTTAAQVATFLAGLWVACLAVPTGNHTCTGVTKIPVTVLVNVTVPVTFRSYTWCLRVPPRCSKYTVQLRDRVQLHTEMHNKTITVCCRGYVEMEGKCVPACPEGADCPFMHCNRTNHCHCTPGYTGLYCNDPCPRGVWGRDCKRPCDCPTGYTCHHLTGDCMVDDRPSRKSTTTTEAPTTTKAPTTPLITTEATTLETVKTPQFRFPPPPWVEAAGTTTPKKLTTRIIRDDVPTSTTLKTPEEMTSQTTPMATVAKTVKPFVIEFFTPPELAATTTPPTTEQTTPTNVYITSKKTEEYLPNTTRLTIETEKTPTTTATTVTTPPSMISETTTPTTNRTTTPTTTTTATPITTPASSPDIITLPSTTPNITTISTTITTPPTTVTTPSTTERTTATSIATKSTSLATTIPTTLPTTTLQTTPSTLQTTPSTTTLQTTPSTTTLQTTPSTTLPTTPSTTSPTTPSTTLQTTQLTTTLKTTTETVRITEVHLETFQETKPIQPVVQTTNILPTSTLAPTSYKDINLKPTISPEFKVIKVIKTDNSPKQKFPTFLESEINTSTDSIPKEPFIINIKTNLNQRTKAKEDGSPIIYISPTSKEHHEVLTTKESLVLKGSGTTVVVPSSTNGTVLKRMDSNTVENEIHLKGTTSTSESTQEKSTSVAMEDTFQQTNRSLMHSLFSGTKVPINIPEEPSANEQNHEKKEIEVTLRPTISEETKNTTPIHKKKTKDYLPKKSDDKSEIKKITFDTTMTTLSPIHILKQLLNASSITTTTILPISENLPPNLEDLDDFTKEMINKKSKYDDLIIPYLAAEKAKKKLEKNKLDKTKHAKEGKDVLITPVKTEKQPDISLPPPTTTSTTEMAEKHTSTTEAVTTTTEKPIISIKIGHTPPAEKSVKSSNEQLTTTLSPKHILQTTPSINKAKDFARIENEIKRFTTEAVTDLNNIVESNTIDTLHTSFEAMKKGLEGDQDDSNYSIIHNKMKFVKTETHYGAAGMTGYMRENSSVTGMLMTLGIALVTLVALTGTLWVYMKRRKRNMIQMRPPIMAYELAEPTPIDVQSLEQTFFCPTFTNNYAEKINRELRELNYDHPRSSPPEPLYAEIRY